MTSGASVRRGVPVLSVLCLALAGGCGSGDGDRLRITIWHQDRVEIQRVLERQSARFMELHPEVRVEQLFKETEELRSSFIIAAIAGQGPEIVYGPSDQVGPFEAMEILAPLEGLFDRAWLAAVDPRGLTWYRGHLYQIADKLGNHLTLVYNRKLVPAPPRTEQELIGIGRALTADLNGDGKIDRYGLVWNYTEPYFFIPFLTGFGGWITDSAGAPTLDTPALVRALAFVRELRDVHRIIPGEADYNVADVLFKNGSAGMIINGDWSWSGYRAAGIDLGVAPLPLISSTGRWCGTMVSPKGFSLNVNATGAKRRWALELIRYLMLPENQREAAREVYTMPTDLAAQQDSFVREDPILRNSRIQIDHGMPMPVVPELRAIWDAMRPNYQAVLAGTLDARVAARRMQEQALQRIREMNE